MHQPATSDEAEYVLLRSAIVGRSDEAWEQLHQQYSRLLISWARGACLRTACPEPPEDIAAIAFARAWAALCDNDFSQFPTISSLLSYMRRCVDAVVIDTCRSMATRERFLQIVPSPSAVSPEQLAVARATNAELRQLLVSLELSKQEWIVLHASFIQGMPPREIWKHYHSHFASLRAIYSVKRNLLARLARSDALRRLYSEP